MEIFATSHGKGVGDGTDGKAKYLVWVKVTSKVDDRIIVQSSNDFSKAAEQLLNKQKWFTFHRKKFAQEFIDCSLRKTTITGSAKEQYSHCYMLHAMMGMQFRHSSTLVVRKWQNSPEDRWKRKINNRFIFFCCYTFDFIFSCLQLTSLIQFFSCFLNAKITISHNSFFKKDFN